MDRDYFPLDPGTVWEYESETSDDVHRLKVEVLSVSGSGGSVTARLRKTVTSPEGTKVSEYEARRTAQGAYTRDYLEFPLPAKAGARWDEAPRAYSIETLAARAEVPAGSFPGCLKVAYLVAGGDGGGGERLYAPGVGFVYERCDEESESFEVRLTAHRNGRK